MSQLIAERNMLYSVYRVGDTRFTKSSIVYCKVVNVCSFERDSAGVMNPNDQYAYTLTSFHNGERYYAFFVTIAFVGANINMIHGNIHIPNVQGDKTYNLFYKDQVVYGLFHALTEYVIFRYDTVNDLFLTATHQTFVDYKRVFVHPNSK